MALPSQLFAPSASWLAATSQGPFNGGTNVAATAPATATQPLAPPPVPFRRRPSLFDFGRQDDPFGYPEDLGGVHDLRPVGSLTPTQQRYLQQVQIDRLGRPKTSGVSKFFDYATRLFPFAGAARSLGERAGLHTRRLGQLTDSLEANRVAMGAYPVGQTSYGSLGGWNQGLGQPPLQGPPIQTGRPGESTTALPPAPVTRADTTRVNMKELPYIWAPQPPIDGYGVDERIMGIPSLPSPSYGATETIDPVEGTRRYAEDELTKAIAAENAYYGRQIPVGDPFYDERDLGGYFNPDAITNNIETGGMPPEMGQDMNNFTDYSDPRDERAFGVYDDMFGEGRGI